MATIVFNEGTPNRQVLSVKLPVKLVIEGREIVLLRSGNLLIARLNRKDEEGDVATPIEIGKVNLRTGRVYKGDKQ